MHVNAKQLDEKEVFFPLWLHCVCGQLFVQWIEGPLLGCMLQRMTTRTGIVVRRISLHVWFMLPLVPVPKGTVRRKLEFFFWGDSCKTGASTIVVVLLKGTGWSCYPSKGTLQGCNGKHSKNCWQGRIEAVLGRLCWGWAEEMIGEESVARKWKHSRAARSVYHL